MFVGAALAVLLIQPVAAQEADVAAELWAAFAAECSMVVASPDGALAGAYLHENGVAARTPDGALATVTRSLLDGNASLNAWIMTANGGRSISCAVTWFDRSGAAEATMSDIVDLAAAGAEDLLGGPPEAFGGPIAAANETGEMRLWTLPGFPAPMSLNVMQSGGIAVLTLGRTIMPDGMDQ